MSGTEQINSPDDLTSTNAITRLPGKSCSLCAGIKEVRPAPSNELTENEHL